jgi:hypothetical protein
MPCRPRLVDELPGDRGDHRATAPAHSSPKRPTWDRIRNEAREHRRRIIGWRIRHLSKSHPTNKLGMKSMIPKRAAAIPSTVGIARLRASNLSRNASAEY